MDEKKQLSFTCKMGRRRGRRRRSFESADEEPQPEGIQMKCECEPSGSQFGIGGCTYPQREHRKGSLVHGHRTRTSDEGD